jgi:hypothetical protein
MTGPQTNADFPPSFYVQDWRVRADHMENSGDGIAASAVRVCADELEVSLSALTAAPRNAVAWGRLREDGNLGGLGLHRDDDAGLSVPLGIIAAAPLPREGGEADWYTSPLGSYVVDWDADPARQLSIMLRRDGGVGWAISVEGKHLYGHDAMSPNFLAALRLYAAPVAAGERVTVGEIAGEMRDEAATHLRVPVTTKLEAWADRLSGLAQGQPSAPAAPVAGDASRLVEIWRNAAIGWDAFESGEAAAYWLRLCADDLAASLAAPAPVAADKCEFCGQWPHGPVPCCNQHWGHAAPPAAEPVEGEPVSHRITYPSGCKSAWLPMPLGYTPEGVKQHRLTIDYAYFPSAPAARPSGDGMLPEVAAWVAAKQEHRRLVAVYNARLDYAKQHDLGRVSCDHEYQAMCQQQKAAAALVEPMFAALEAAPVAGARPSGDDWRAVLKIAGEMEGIAPTCEADWDEQLRDWAKRLRVAAAGARPSGEVTGNKALAALAEVEAYFADRQDVNDGDYGVPEPNTEMRMAQELEIVRSALQAALGPATPPAAERDTGIDAAVARGDLRNTFDPPAAEGGEWVRVPREPTDEMLIRGRAAFMDGARMLDGWRAMLAASPTPPAAPPGVPLGDMVVDGDTITMPVPAPTFDAGRYAIYAIRRPAASEGGNTDAD